MRLGFKYELRSTGRVSPSSKAGFSASSSSETGALRVKVEYRVSGFDMFLESMSFFPVSSDLPNKM